MTRRHRRNLPRHSPRRARPAAAPDPAVMAEQEAMNKLLRKLYGPNARQLIVDGRRGPATDGVGEFLDKAFPPQQGESRQQRAERLTAGLDTQEGQQFRADPANAQAFNELEAGVNGLRETRNGFMPRSGPAPDPAAPVPGRPDPAAPRPDAVPPNAGPAPIPADETAEQMRARIEREGQGTRLPIPADETADQMRARLEREQPTPGQSPAPAAAYDVVDLSVGATPRAPAAPAAAPRVQPPVR